MVKWIFLLLLPFCQPLIASQSVDDFAFRADITAADGQLQRLQLPIKVLPGITQNNLADVVIFDSNGTVLPYSILKSNSPVLKKQLELNTHAFDSFHQNSSKVVTTRTQKQQQGLLSELEITETIAAKQRRSDYLIELPLQYQLDYLELEWTQLPVKQMLSVKLEAGTSLDNLRVFNSNKLLSNIDPDQPHWRRISNLPAGQKYLRIAATSQIQDFSLIKAIGHYRQQQPAPVIRYSIDYSEVKIKNQPYLYFETPTAMTAEALRIIPAQQHSMINATLYASRNDFEHKRQIRSGFSQHNITGSNIEPSKPVSLPGSNYRYWWVSLQNDPGVMPEIQLIFPQYEIVFLASDNPPFTLAWGNYQLTANTTRLTELVRTDFSQTINRGVTVAIENIRTAGGRSRLVSEPGLPWEKWILWILLIFAALLTGRMAYKLFQDMNVQSPK